MEEVQDAFARKYATKINQSDLLYEKLRKKEEKEKKKKGTRYLGNCIGPQIRARKLARQCLGANAATLLSC